MADSSFDQRPARVRTAWGLAGARALTETDARKSLVVVVDVLFFSTAVTVACETGAGVYPFPYRDPAGAARLARTMKAVLADSRSSEGVNFSPTSLRNLDADRLVLSSPNGSMISHTVASRGALVVAGCLRNISAVAGLAAAHLDAHSGHDLVLAPTGDLWTDGSLRPTVEDHLCAGAIASRVMEILPQTASSSETRAAVTLWRGSNRGEELLDASTDGLFLDNENAGEDAAMTTAVDATDVVPVLMDGSYVPLGRRIAAARKAGALVGTS